jgi:hypothetical protein
VRTIEKLKIELKDLIAQASPEDVLRRLREDLLLPQSNLYNDVVLTEARYRESNRAGVLGLIDFKDESRQFANINQALIWLVDRLKEADLKPVLLVGHTANGLYALSCDRNDQYDFFDELRPQFQPGSLHFFYLYGGELQAHKSFFRRIYLELAGRYADQPERPVTAVDFAVEDCRRPELLRQRFLRNLYAALGLKPLDNSPLAHQNFADLLLKADKTRDLRRGSYLCVFVHVSHWYWDRTLTPDVARWFIAQFCPAQLDPDSPTVLFFFAFDFNEEENEGVRDEVLEVVHAEAEQVRPFPELDMVRKRDVAQWLVRYDRHFGAGERQKILQNIASEYCMADLEPILKKLIDDYFNAHTDEY